MSVEAFVTIHDQDLLLDCERSGQFASLSHTYLFVGPRPVDRVPRGVKMVVARDYAGNVEHLPSFYDFTGWHVLARHDLIDAEHVICLQYDMTVDVPDLAEQCAAILHSERGMIAFTSGPRSHWMLRVPGFEDAYQRGMAEKGIDTDAWPPVRRWPTTQGTAWRAETLVDFMGWFEPLFDVWADETLAGHLAERSVTVYSMTTHPERYLTGVIKHQALDCHGTGALLRTSLRKARSRAQ